MNTTAETIDEPRVFAAYLVLFESLATRTIDRIAIYSEPSPTCPTSHRTMVLYETRSTSYAEARKEMDAIVRKLAAQEGCA